MDNGKENGNYYLGFGGVGGCVKIVVPFWVQMILRP